VTSSIGLRDTAQSKASVPEAQAAVEEEIAQQQLEQVQQHMLMYYVTEAYKKKDGPPSALPIFCTQCYRPFTYPVGAVSIKCPMCLSVVRIPQTGPVP
jgi:LSD1 subclass zinc finger protein